MTTFVDAHVHPPVSALIDGPLTPYVAGLEAATGRTIEPIDGAEIVDFFRARDARAMIVGWDLETSGNRRPFSSADVAQIVGIDPEVLGGWGAVDPAKGALAVSQVHEAARLGMRGIAVHPAAQGSGPSDRLASPVWEAAADHGLVCLIHTGTTRLGFGIPGGSGVKLGAGDPMHVDAIAARLPQLKILLAHTGPLWQEEAIAVALHKGNVYLCPTAATPSSWPMLAEIASGPLADRIVFGSGYPVGDPDALVKEWQTSGLPTSTLQKILVDNATTLLAWP